MRLKWIEKILVMVVLVLTIVDAALLIAVRYMANTVNTDVSHIYRDPDIRAALTPPMGFSASGDKLSSSFPGQGGWAVRFASQNCHFCKQDEYLWAKMATKLASKHVPIYVVVPSARDAYAPGAQTQASVIQESYVNVGWIKEFHLTKTPTLLIFDGRRGLIWSHEGTLNSVDITSAARIVDSLSNPH